MAVDYTGTVHRGFMGVDHDSGYCYINIMLKDMRDCVNAF